MQNRLMNKQGNSCSESGRMTAEILSDIGVSKRAKKIKQETILFFYNVPSRAFENNYNRKYSHHFSQIDFGYLSTLMVYYNGVVLFCLFEVINPFWNLADLSFPFIVNEVRPSLLGNPG